MEKSLRNEKGRTENLKTKHNLEKKFNSSIKLIIPRDVQNANSLLFSQINLNKYTWEKDGEKILNSQNTILNYEEKRIFKFLIMKNIPSEKRRRFWLLASGALSEMKNNKNYYSMLTEKYPKNIPSPYIDQIKLDLKRTYPDDPFFNCDRTIIKLQNILLAYSRRNFSIGYCQGFNFIVGKLLKIFDVEEEAFWVFVQIIEQILPLNYFSNMAGVMVDSAIFNRFLQIYLPDLFNFLMNLGFEMHLNNIIFKWFASIYSCYFSEEHNLILWDVLFLDGSIVLFKAALGLFKILKAEIMLKSSIEAVQNLIEDQGKNYLYSSLIFYYLILRRFEFNTDLLNKNRELYQSTIMETFFKAQEKMKIEKRKLIEDSKNNKIKSSEIRRNSFCNKMCNVNWPICIYDTFYKNEIKNFFIFKICDEVVIIKDYYFSCKYNSDNCSSNKSFNGSQHSNENSLIIETENKFSKIKKTQSKKKSKFRSKIIVQANSEEYKKREHEANKIKGRNHNDLVHYTIKSNINYIVDCDKSEKFNGILIERRSHFCLLFNDCSLNEKEDNDKEGQIHKLLCKKPNENKNVCSKKQRKNSLGNPRPYFIDFPSYSCANKAKNQKDKSFVYSNFISNLRENTQNKQQDLFKSLDFTINPSSSEDLINLDGEVIYDL